MDPTAFRSRRSPSSPDRLLSLFPFSPPSDAAAGDELNEAELLWAGDVAEMENRRPVSATADRKRRPTFDLPQNSGIVDLLIQSDCHTGDEYVLCRKSFISSFQSASRTTPSIPRPPVQNPPDKEYVSKSVPGGKFQQSAPVKVPVPSSKAMPRRRNREFGFVDDDVEDDDEMLPPHEIVARGSGLSPKITFSVLEGVGRTLKGRDLRQVRNAIWRKTGFLD